MNNVATAGKLQGYSYLLYFITRSFLIAILCFICFLTILFLGYFVDLSLHSNRPLFGAYVIVSPSMVPTIKINDAIIIKRVDHDQYRIGDIITFMSSDGQYQGLTITHRVVDKVVENEGILSQYTTKGDNNTAADPTPVFTNDIYGKVLFKIPNVGYVQSFFSKPINFFICLLVLGMLFTLYEVFRMFFMLSNSKKAQ